MGRCPGYQNQAKALKVPGELEGQGRPRGFSWLLWRGPEHGALRAVVGLPPSEIPSRQTHSLRRIRYQLLKPLVFALNPLPISGFVFDKKCAEPDLNRTG